MNLLKNRFAVFLLLIIVAFATCVYAHPDGSQSYNSADWGEWALYSVGNQFVDLAHSDFSQLTSTDVSNNAIDSQLDAQSRIPPSHPQLYRATEGDRAAYAPAQFQHAPPMSYDTPRSIPSYAEGQAVTSFAQETIMSNAVQIGMIGNTQQWRPGQLLEPATTLGPFSTGVQSSAMTQTHASMGVGYPAAGLHSLNQQFMGTGMNQGMQHSSIQAGPGAAFEEPRSYPYQPETLSDPLAFNRHVSSATADHGLDVTSNYNFQAGMNESAGGMMGWLRRASTFGDRVMPRVETSLLQLPASGVRNQAPPSPSSASTTNSSSRFSSSKRNRTQMIVGQHPFVCHLCNAGFRAQGDLTHHLRCHQPYENRAHQCIECGKRFQYRKDLNRHLPKHDPNAPRYYCPHYGCKYATKGFGRQDHLDRHVSTQHRADTPQQGASPAYM